MGSVSPTPTAHAVRQAEGPRPSFRSRLAFLLVGCLAALSCSSTSTPAEVETAGAETGQVLGIPGASGTDELPAAGNPNTPAEVVNTEQPEPPGASVELPVPPPNTGFEPPETGFELYTPKEPEFQLSPAREVVTIAEAMDQVLAMPQAQGQTVAITVWVDGYGEVYSHNPEELLLPASNQKIFTGIGALSLLPSTHRFTTRFASDAAVVDGVLQGDLYLVAGGDPTLTVSGLENLAEALGRAGIGRVSGDLVLDITRWDSNRRAPGWALASVPWDIGPLSAFILDRNTYRTDDDFVNNPNFGNGEVLARVLMDHDIEIDGVLRQATAPAGSAQLASLSSAAVPDLVDRMMTWSDNLIAEALVREVGVVASGQGSHETGLAAIQNAVIALGVPIVGADGDGSGLSQANLHTSREIMQLLKAIEGQPWYDRFVAGFPVASRSGTLWRRLPGESTAANVRAKTGTIRGVVALSGFVTTDQGDPAIFSILINGPSANSAVPVIDAAVTAVAESNGFDTLAPLDPDAGADEDADADEDAEDTEDTEDAEDDRTEDDPE